MHDNFIFKFCYFIILVSAGWTEAGTKNSSRQTISSSLQTYRDYFEKELNIPVFFKPIQKEIFGKNFFIGHGDGLGPDDTGFKLMKKVLVLV